MKTKTIPTVRLLLAILMCLPVLSSHLSAQTAESYAVYDEASFTLTFKHDANKPAGAYALNRDHYVPSWFVEDDGSGNNANIIKKVVFDASFAEARPTNCFEWFYGCDNLTTIEGIENLNTENVTNMSEMFHNCTALKTLDVSNFDTKNVTEMYEMFSGCSALETLDVSNFDTKNVINMGWMFSHCSALKTLDVSNFDTKNVECMTWMFGECSALETLDVSNFDTRNVMVMDWMFGHCSALKTLDLSNFNTQYVTSMVYMFYDCHALKTIYASDLFVTTAVVTYYFMFLDCDSLVGAVPYDENKTGKEMANYTTGYFTYKEPTGIATPTVSDNTAAEYYDLQGRRLNAPQKGVNIVKRGKKTTKVLMN